MSRFTEVAEWDWVYSANMRGQRLHHLASVGEHHDDDTAATGTTTCGKTGDWRIPGLLSRMGMERCPKCCDRLGWPQGTGSPKNDEALRPLVERRLAGAA